jgi:hypothetical protein
LLPKTIEGLNWWMHTNLMTQKSYLMEFALHGEFSLIKQRHDTGIQFKVDNLFDPNKLNRAMREDEDDDNFGSDGY